MHHSDGRAVWSCNNVYFGIVPRKRLFQYQHCKDRGSRRNVACFRQYRVCGGHSRSRVALGGTEFYSRFQGAGRVKKPCAAFGKRGVSLSRAQNLWEYLPDVAAEIFFRKKLGKLFDVCFIVSTVFNWEYSRSLAHAHAALSRKEIVDIPRKSVYMGDFGYVLLAVQNRLIKMGNAPPLGDIELKSFGKLRGSLLGNGVPPCPERNEKLILFVEGHVAVHHARYAHCAVGFGDSAVPLLYVFREARIAALQSPDNVVE